MTIHILSNNKKKSEEIKGKSKTLGWDRQTSKDDVRDTMLAGDVNGIRNETVERFTDHGKISGVLEELESRRVDMEAIFQEKVDSHPWKAPETLNPEADAENSPDPIGSRSGRRNHLMNVRWCSKM